MASLERLGVSHASDAEALGGVAALEGADDAARAPRFSALDEVSGEWLEVFVLQREAAEWVAAHGVETGRNEDEIGSEVARTVRDRGLQRVDVRGGGKTARHLQTRDVW